MAKKSKNSSTTFEKNYIGKGKNHATLDITKVTIDMGKAESFIYEYEGRRYLSFEVSKMLNPDEYGKTHTCYVNTKVKKD